MASSGWEATCHGVGMRRAAAFLIVAMMGLSALGALSSGAQGDIGGLAIGSASPGDTSESFAGGTPIPAGYHLMTLDEMNGLKAQMGVREAGVDYNIVIDGHGTGLAPPTEEEWNQMVGHVLVAGNIEGTPSLPASYDLTGRAYFPAVGNQGGQGSCAAWAATYYDYGFLEAKDSNWTQANSGNAAQLMSPAWTYNKVCGGSDTGSWMTDNLQVLLDDGGATLSTMGYDDGDCLSFGTPSAWREAPLHRAASYATVPQTGQAAVDLVKALLVQDKPVTFALDAGQYSAALSGDNIISSSEYNAHSYNHANTIVGYSDSAGNDGEVGAFRVVNSWGTGFGDHGFYWLTYAAFIKISYGAGLFLTYAEDRLDYIPEALAVWQFNAAPGQDATATLSVGAYPSASGSTSAYYADVPENRLPTFMCLDITDLLASYDSSRQDFWLRMGSSSLSGTTSSFKIEFYDSGYSPGRPSWASDQSPNVPAGAATNIRLHIDAHPMIDLDTALDCPGLATTSMSLARWVAVDHHSSRGGSSVQSGDVGNGDTSVLQSVVAGPQTVTFNWSVSSELNKDYLRFSIDGTQMAAISDSVDWATRSFSVPTGNHTLRWTYSKDSTGASGADAGWIDDIQFSTDPPVDDTPPTTTASLAGTAGGGWYRSSVTVTLSATDDGSGVASTWYQLDGAALIRYVGPFTVSAEGSHTVRYNSTDGAGNQEAQRSIAVKIDLTAPATTLTPTGTIGLAGWFVSSVTLHLSASDAVSGVGITMCSLDGAAFIQFGTDLLVGDDGPHTMRYYSMDRAGNQEDVRNYAFNIDTNAPSGGIDLAGSNGTDYWYRSNVTVSLSAHDAASGVEAISYRIDGGPESPYTVPFEVSAEGNHTISMMAKDVAGNREDWQTRSFGIDSAAPSTTATLNGSAGEDGWYRSAVTVCLNSTDLGSGVATVEARLDGGSWTPFSDILVVSAEGDHTLEYRAADGASNIEETGSVSFKIDTCAPSSSVELSGATGLAGWFTSNVTAAFSAVDGVSGVAVMEFSLDGSPWQNGAMPADIDSDGIHSLALHSVDVAGNEDLRTLIIAIDRAQPTVTLNLSGERHGEWFASGVSLSLSAIDDVSGVSHVLYRVDSGPFQDYLFPVNLTEDGAHLVEYYAVDGAGNQGAAQMSEVDIDQAPPLTSISALGDLGGSGWYVSRVVINITAEDAASGVATILFRLGGGEWVIYEGEIAIAANGTHTIEAYAVDEAGNPGPSQTSTYRIDRSCPTVAYSVDGAQGEGGWHVGPVTVSLIAADGESGLSFINLTLDDGPARNYNGSFLVTGDGVHRVTARAVDRAGNEGPEAGFEVRIDTTLPECELAIDGSKGTGDWFTSEVAVTPRAVDNVSGVAAVEYALDEGIWYLFSGPLIISLDGIHSLSYRALDLAGNLMGPENVTIAIDTSRPALAFDAVSGQTYTSTAGHVGWTVTSVEQGEVRFEVSVDHGPFAPVTGSAGRVELAHMTDGDHNLTVRATDAAGNTAFSSLDFRIDTNPLSPTGPNGIWPAALLVLLVSGLVIWFAMRLRRR